MPAVQPGPSDVNTSSSASANGSALYIASASHDLPAGPWGEFLTARHASPAWALYGKKGLVENHPYCIGVPFQEGNVAYHLREGRHDLTLEDWNNYMDFADRHGWRITSGK